jgi:hypothetical protein
MLLYYKDLKLNAFNMPIEQPSSKEAVPLRKYEVFKQVSDRIGVTTNFEVINRLLKNIKEKKAKDDPNLESNYDDLENVAVKRIADLIANAPKHAENTSPESQAVIDASLKEANIICQKRIDNLVKIFNTGKDLSIDQKNQLNLFYSLQASINNEISMRKIQSAKKLKQAA